MRSLSVTLAAALYATALAAEPPDAARGKEVFAAHCKVCHTAADQPRKLGPNLTGLFKRPRLSSGKRTSEAAVRALIDSGARGMPPYKEMLSPSQKEDLLAFLKTQ